MLLFVCVHTIQTTISKIIKINPPLNLIFYYQYSLNLGSVKQCIKRYWIRGCSIGYKSNTWWFAFAFFWPTLDCSNSIQGKYFSSYKLLHILLFHVINFFNFIFNSQILVSVATRFALNSINLVVVYLPETMREECRNRAWRLSEKHLNLCFLAQLFWGFRC